ESLPVKLTLTAFAAANYKTSDQCLPVQILEAFFVCLRQLTGLSGSCAITCRSTAERMASLSRSSLLTSLSAYRLAYLEGVCVMSSSTLLERGSSAVAPFSGPGIQPGVLPSGSPAGANWCVLPRCTVEFEKTSNGCKIHCRCDDEVARGTLQNLCRML